MIRVVVVDDEALVRSAFTLILNTAPDITVVGATSGADAFALIRDRRPDVVLLDIRMPVVDGLTVLRQVRALAEPPVVAMLTTFGADEYVLTALHSGAAGFLLKDTDPEGLAQLVRTLSAGGVVMSRPAVRALENSLPRIAPDRLGDLGEQDRELLGLIAGGLTNAEIGDRRGVSAAEVREHVGALLATLRVSTRVQAALLVRGT